MKGYTPIENVHIGKTVEMEVVPDEGTASA